jgi:hypothetical protein
VRWEAVGADPQLPPPIQSTTVTPFSLPAECQRRAPSAMLGDCRPSAWRQSPLSDTAASQSVPAWCFAYPKGLPMRVALTLSVILRHLPLETTSRIKPTGARRSTSLLRNSTRASFAAEERHTPVRVIGLPENRNAEPSAVASKLKSGAAAAPRVGRPAHAQVRRGGVAPLPTSFPHTGSAAGCHRARNVAACSIARIRMRFTKRLRSSSSGVWSLSLHWTLQQM